MKHTHTLLIGENASGKSAVIKEYIIEMLDRGEEIYYVDSVNRYFDVSKVSTPYPQIQNSSNVDVIKTRVEKEYFNLKDTFSLFGTLNDQIELIYLGYEKEIIPENEIQVFDKDHCKPNCTIPCDKYLRIKSVFLNNKAAHIILQPGGVWGEDTKNPLKLQYDVLKSSFQPSNKYQYSEQEIEFIEDHIRRFRLNGEREKTKQLAAFLKDTIDHQGYYTNMEYNHYIVELFVDQLQGKTREEILKICKSLYIKAVMKFQVE